MAEKEHEHFIHYELNNEPESIGSLVCSNILLSLCILGKCGELGKARPHPALAAAE